jgi:hypothetical protein
MEAIDLRKTIEPKSDQLNADDLLDCTKDITVTGVRLHSSDDQPVSIHYEGDDGRPFKPCKSMRRVLIAAWGNDGALWAGRSMRLFCDPKVRFGSDAVGGIRISHLTDIDGPKSYMLTVTRGKKREYRVSPMDKPQRAPYPAELFAEKLPTILAWIKSGDGTPEQAIARLERDGALTEEQRAQVRAAA